MKDLTLIYLSANLLPLDTRVKVLDHLITSDKNYPFIRVIQGVNYPLVGSSPYNYYKQILAGCIQASTEFVATCEDDTLYPAEHFTHRPIGDYAFNTNAWLGSNKVFWQSNKPMNSFGFYISRRLALIDLLLQRFETYPEPPPLLLQRHFHEPGVFEYDNPVTVETFKTEHPIIAFEHRGTLSGKRKRFGNPGVKTLDGLSAKDLYDNYFPV